MALAVLLASLSALAACEHSSDAPSDGVDESESVTDQGSEDETGESETGETGEEPPPGAIEDGPGVYPDVPHIIAIGDVHGDIVSTGDVWIEHYQLRRKALAQELEGLRSGDVLAIARVEDLHVAARTALEDDPDE